MSSELSISPLSDSALLVSFGNLIDESINRKVLYLFYHLKELCIPSVKDIVPAYSSLAIHYDSTVLQQKNITGTAFEILSGEIKKIAGNYIETPLPPSRTIKVPICYSERFALDIREIAGEKKIPVEEVKRIHMQKRYRVYMIGFLPGFAYMGEVDEQIAMPRRQQPRTNVEAGSVGIAGKQTGIYPFTSPGGWQIIGKTPLSLFNKDKEDPVLFHPGDEVEFYSITEDEFANNKSGNT